MTASAEGGDGDGNDEWRFSLDDLGDDDGDSEGDASVAGGFAPSEVVEPGDVDPENAFFVLVGVLIAGLFVGGFVATML
ncbi:MAG: hypothetical protein ABEH56_03430 [Salinirussus sp.]